MTYDELIAAYPDEYATLACGAIVHVDDIDNHDRDACELCEDLVQFLKGYGG